MSFLAKLFRIEAVVAMVAQRLAGADHDRASPPYRVGRRCPPFPEAGPASLSRNLSNQLTILTLIHSNENPSGWPDACSCQ